MCFGALLQIVTEVEEGTAVSIGDRPGAHAVIVREGSG
jgi:hypothetical protein